MAISFPLRTAFAKSHRFWNNECLFSLVSRYFLTSSLISSLIHYFFPIIFFCLPVFVVFAFSLCNYFLISYSVVTENAWYNFCFLKFVETCIFCGIACPGQCSMCTWKECIFCCFWMEYSINIYSIQLD